MFSRNLWKVLGIGKLECVSYGVVCDMFYCVDCEMALINEDDCQERDCALNCADSSSRHILGVFEKKIPLIYAHCSSYIMRCRHLFVECLI